ncbi:MAG: DUF4838 domain-containing protein [Rhodopirellula sp.]|nr:DUF4838 domain-containing protein [Rhodopirellula sp.]
MTTLRWLTWFFLLAPAMTGRGEDLTLVADGQPRAVIVLADKPSGAARQASQLLQNLVAESSGAKLALVNEGALSNVCVEDGELQANAGDHRPPSFVLVGESKLTERLGASSEGLGPGGILLRTYPNALVALGADEKTPADPDGTRHAVVTLLEDVLGVRFLWPGELGQVVPPHRTIRIAAMDRRYTPRIGQRRIRNSHYNDRIQVGLDYLGLAKADLDRQMAAIKTDEWFRWQRLGGSVGISAGHAFGYTWEKYHREHPEWFAMQPNGSRDLSRLSPERARLCKSNLALIDALARDKIEELRRTGGKAASLCPNDGGAATFCQCPGCKQLDPPEGRPVALWDRTSKPAGDFEYVSLTDRMVWFWNHLAERIGKEYPDAWLGVYAYSVYKSPPVKERLHPNLAVGFVGVSYALESDRQQALADWEAWSKMAGKIYWRPNLLLFGRRTGTPAVYVHKLADDLRFFAERSLVGTDFDSCTHNWATEGLNFYVLSRLLWNPEADADAMIDDYCQAGFGRSWREVRRYFDRIEQTTSLIATEGLGLTVPYTPQVVAELKSLLDAADNAADDDTIRRRVTFLRRGLEFTALQHKAHALIESAEEGRVSPELKASLRIVQQEKWLLMRRIFREDPMAINVAGIAWGGEGVFRRFGWSGAKSVPQAVIEADEEGRPVQPEEIKK